MTERIICGLWGMAQLGSEPMKLYCNQKPDHDGGHRYTNWCATDYPLSDVEAPR